MFFMVIVRTLDKKKFIIQNSQFIIMITVIIHNLEFIMHNYDYRKLLCLLIYAVC